MYGTTSSSNGGGETSSLADKDDMNNNNNDNNDESSKPKVAKRYEDMSHDMIQQCKRRERKLHFEDKSDNIIFFSVFIQFLLMDAMIGYDYYPKTFNNRIIRNFTQFVIILIAFTNFEMKWLGFFWVSEYSELIKYLSLMTRYSNDKTDVRIYQITHISFQLFYPTCLIYYIYIEELA